MKSLTTYINESESGTDMTKVMKWLEENCKITGGVEILDGKINVDGDVVVRDEVRKFPYPFGEVTGDFNCVYCELTSLENSPQKVGGDFNCSNCDNLKSLEGAPKEVGGFFSCTYCENLKSLKGAPKETGSSFICSNCDSLKSLEYAPKETGGNFICSNCKNLTSLESAPKKVGGNFGCSNCGKEFTEEDVQKVCKVKGYIYK